MAPLDVNQYEKEVTCTYKDDTYSVRDNGAVLRHARKGKRLRKYDNLWTFGKPNNNGYMLIASEVVHRIVAYAFLGEPETDQHIVDHIDTNRQNNRPENLRWLTKLENILKNPITVKKIIFHCGSIEAFLKDPSILRNHVSKDPNFEWMRAVTPEEARISWKRLNNWEARKSNNTSSKGRALGEWIFQDNGPPTPSQEMPEIISSLTPNAIQKNWKTPSEFPYCPQLNTNSPIATYAVNLKIGEIFSRNQYSTTITIDFVTSKDEDTLWVLCKNSDENSLKPWSLTQVTYEDESYVHKSLGSFFKRDSAKKQFTLAQGMEWTGGDTFDDLIS